MNATIEIDGLRKRFGPVQALDEMTFTVQPGHVTGFVGPNGAGKSTTMRVVVGLDAPDAGTATIGGRPYRTLKNPLTHVGSLLDAGALQPGRSGRNHLLWLAHSQGITAGRVDEVIALAGLQAAARRKAGGYSLGMRQRLGIAAALLGDPPVLIFDEPYNGMDPEGIFWMKDLLRSLAAQDRTVLVSSHLMGELEGTADHLVVIGRALAIAIIVRRSAPAIRTAIVVIFVPYLLTVGVGPQGGGHGRGGGGGWVLPATPVAAMAVQQALPKFYQVAAAYVVVGGYYPLAPWAGLAVECAWAAAALALAFLLLRRRDA